MPSQPCSFHHQLGSVTLKQNILVKGIVAFNFQSLSAGLNFSFVRNSWRFYLLRLFQLSDVAHYMFFLWWIRSFHFLHDLMMSRQQHQFQAAKRGNGRYKTKCLASTGTWALCSSPLSSSATSCSSPISVDCSFSKVSSREWISVGFNSSSYSSCTWNSHQEGSGKASWWSL